MTDFRLIYRRLIFFLAVLSATATSAMAQNPDSADEASFLIRNGSPADAEAMLGRLIKATPKRSDLYMLLGQSREAQGNLAGASDAWRDAAAKGDNNARLELARILALDYRLDEAEAEIELYRKGLKKGRKTLPDLSGEVTDLMMRIDNMMQRVEKIVVIDSTEVDADDFFRHYNLLRRSGRIVGPDDLANSGNLDMMRTAYLSPDSSHLIAPILHDDGQLSLSEQFTLLDGSRESAPITFGGQELQADCNFPFMLSDGVTLYFASDGEESLGGYDIFMSRRGDDGNFLQPRNPGMPYNSPANDYLLAIDEERGVGWWATDRNAAPGKVTIFTFIPSEVRTNVDGDSPSLRQLASMSNYKLTWGDKDYSAMAAKVRIPEQTQDAAAGQQFDPISIPGFGLLTSAAPLTTQTSRRALKAYLDKAQSVRDLRSRMARLKENYGKGDTSLAEEILELENRVDTETRQAVRLRNNLIEAMQKR